LLIEAVEAKNPGEIEMLSHALKGSAATIAAKSLSQAACQLNHAVKANNINHFESLLDDVQIEFDRLKTLLDQPDWIQIVKAKTEDKKA
jgi:HPt (histidine-containing phosphotransfer) domain-containing protein